MRSITFTSEAKSLSTWRGGNGNCWPHQHDAHTHLQNYPQELLPKVLYRARAVGVIRFECCATQPSDWVRVLEISQQEDGVEPSFGLHPWFVDSIHGTNWEEQLEKILLSIPHAGIGEIGLDARREHPLQQKKVFITQLKIAKKYNRRISLHCVKSESELIPLLKPYANHLPQILFHAPSFSIETWKQVEHLGAYVSVGGEIFNPRAIRVHALARIIPEERLLFETDSPNRPIRGCSIPELNGLSAPEFLPAIQSQVHKLRVKDCH